MHIFTDWEGPWILTDIAYELAVEILGNPEFFERLSQYDDYLAYAERKPGYQAGDTLKLLAPFLVAGGITSEKIREISVQTARFVGDSGESMSLLQKALRPVVISTSYSEYLRITAEMMGIKGDLHGTSFNPERYAVGDSWKKWLLEKVDVIASLGEIDIGDPDQESVRYLNNLFWKEIPETPFRNVMEDVEVVGSRRKREIVESYGESRVVAVGDSISDIEMFDYAREVDGMALSFNGNEYALKHANIAVISDSAMAEAVVVLNFIQGGFDAVKEIAEVGHDLLDGVKYQIHFEIDDDVIRKSIRMRKKLRGKAGELG